MKTTLSKLFNWKDNPSSVFFIALPLAALGFLCIFMTAFLQWKINGDYWYAIITFIGCTLAYITITPLAKRIINLKKHDWKMKAPNLNNNKANR